MGARPTRRFPFIRHSGPWDGRPGALPLALWRASDLHAFLFAFGAGFAAAAGAAAFGLAVGFSAGFAASGSRFQPICLHAAQARGGLSPVAVHS
jgi:hypothetical protein